MTAPGLGNPRAFQTRNTHIFPRILASVFPVNGDSGPDTEIRLPVCYVHFCFGRLKYRQIYLWAGVSVNERNIYLEKLPLWAKP